MNDILQQRIDDAAHEFDKEGLRVIFENGANFILNNLWISVEEALPEIDGHGYSNPVLVMNDVNELLVATYSKIYDKWNVVGPVSYHRLVVTHWMPIPSLGGGEK